MGGGKNPIYPPFLENPCISSEEVLHISQQAVSAFYVSKELKALSTTAPINTGNLFVVSNMATIEKYMEGNNGENIELLEL